MTITDWTFMDQRGSPGADPTAPKRDDSDAAAAAAYAEYESSSSARDEGSARHLASHARRATNARSRGVRAAERDRVADEHDELARRRDARTETIDQGISNSKAPLAEKFERLRAQAPADRRRAADDRAEAADDRARAADDRARAADDRAEAADDRARAAGDLARLEVELEHANLDNLTGAYRREMGTVALTHEIDRARRGEGKFVIAFVDVDGMKQVNDRDGHAAGDEVLKTLVWHMRSNLRSFDPVVRYGGDEFVAGMAGVCLDEVGRRFELIDQSVRRDVGVGISVGLAELEPDETLDQLTARADAVLLDAKTHRAG